MTRRPRTRAAAVLPVAAALLVGAGGAAYAAAQARATGVQGLGPVATFGAQVGPRTGPVQAGSYVLSFAANSTVEQYGVLRSTGGLAVTGQTWTVRATSTVTTNTVRVDVCQGGTFNGGGQCPGGTLRNLGTVAANGTPSTWTTAFALPGTHEVKLTPVLVSAVASTTVSVDLGVSRAQTSPGATTTSS